MTIAELKIKPFAERLLLMEELWETLSNEDNHLQSPAWHQKILEERMNLIHTGQAEYVTIEELKKLVLKKQNPSDVLRCSTSGRFSP